MHSWRSRLWRPTPDRLLLAVIALLIFWVVAITISGGIDVRPAGIRISSRDPSRPAGLALILMLVYVARFRTQAAANLAHLAAMERRLSLVPRLAPIFAAGIAIAILGVGLACATFVAGSADSYGYISQSKLWLAGRLTQEQPFVQGLPWPNADLTFAPLGYRPALSGGGVLVPTYAPGLPILMALATLVAGECGPYLVVPILGALTVWLTYRLGVRLGSHTWGLAAAALLALSPAFLWMLMWPMTDIPITALTTAAIVLLFPESRGRTVAAGLVLSLAQLVRPNLAPLVAVFALFILLRARDRRSGVVNAALFIAGVLPGAIAVGLIQTRLYGAPWKSGYGDFDSLFAWRHTGTNLWQFGGWLLDTQTPLVLAAIVPLWSARRGPLSARGGFAILGAVTAAVWLAYLFYLPFDHWSYLRFLLPSFPLMLLLACVGWQMLTARLPSDLRTVILLGLFLIVGGWELGWARNEPTFRQRDGESAYISAATYINQHLPRNAMILTMQHSGSVRYYTGRLTMRYDWMESEWWTRTMEVLQARGYRPYVLLPKWEEEAYRTRLGLPAGRDAIGTVIAELRDPVTLRIYDPLTRPSASDRAVGTPPPAIIPRVDPCPCPWQRGFSRAVSENPRVPE